MTRRHIDIEVLDRVTKSMSIGGIVVSKVSHTARGLGSNLAICSIIPISISHNRTNVPLLGRILLCFCAQCTDYLSVSILVVTACLLSFYILATYRAISWWVPTSDTAHPWQLYTAAQLGNEATIIMIWYPTHSYYPDSDLKTPCPIWIMLSAWLESDKYQF